MDTNLNTTSSTTSTSSLDEALSRFAEGIKTHGTRRERARREAYASIRELEDDGWLVIEIDGVVIVTF